MELQELSEFVAREARLLDEKRWDEWLSMFTDDGRYWVPLAGDEQVDRASYNSLADEDRLLLRLHVERLKNPRAHSQHPPRRCQHVLQASTFATLDTPEHCYELRTPFVYFEFRADRQLILAGTYRHRLLHAEGGLRIQLKRVDLLDAGVALPAIELFV